MPPVLLEALWEAIDGLPVGCGPGTSNLR